MPGSAELVAQRLDLGRDDPQVLGDQRQVSPSARLDRREEVRARPRAASGR